MYSHKLHEKAKKAQQRFNESFTNTLDPSHPDVKAMLQLIDDLFDIASTAVTFLGECTRKQQE